MIIENYAKECSYEEFLAFLIEENEEREVEEADYNFLLNPENIGCCNECPENKGFSDWQRRKPCGQQICWIEAHCYR